MTVQETTPITCGICLELIARENQGDTVDCTNHHSYHNDPCFQAWRTAYASRHPGDDVTCPTCRTPVIGTALPANDPTDRQRAALDVARALPDDTDRQRALSNIARALLDNYDLLANVNALFATSPRSASSPSLQALHRTGLLSNTFAAALNAVRQISDASDDGSDSGEDLYH
jgi:hypothetical protein